MKKKSPKKRAKTGRELSNKEAKRIQGGAVHDEYLQKRERLGEGDLRDRPR